MSGASEATWKILDWDSEFFGFPVARAVGPPSETAIARAVTECAEQGVRCLCFLAESGDMAVIRGLERQGFGFVDVRLTLIHQSPGAGLAGEIPGIRPARPEDLPALQGIARVSHRDTRFYADPNFPRDRCDALYETWIARSCKEGFADVVFVAQTACGEACGYITCSMIQADRGQIGLLAVGPEARGGGVGGRLIRQALLWARARGAGSMVTVTQGGNVSAVRAYERCGFVAERVQFWFHRWFGTQATIY